MTDRMQEFATRAEALAESAQMRRYGWPEAVVERVDVDGADDPVWVICAAGALGGTPVYLRHDGYVR